MDGKLFVMESTKGGIIMLDLKKMTKKAWKKMGALTLAGAIAVTGVSGGTVVQAADVKSASWKLFYESEGHYTYTKYVDITYYAGTNYYQNGAFSGSASANIVTCTGYNVILSETIRATKAYSTTFTAKLKSDATNSEHATYKIFLDATPHKSVSVSGKVYIK